MHNFTIYVPFVCEREHIVDQKAKTAAVCYRYRTESEAHVGKIELQIRIVFVSYNIVDDVVVVVVVVVVILADHCIAVFYSSLHFRSTYPDPPSIHAHTLTRLVGIVRASGVNKYKSKRSRQHFNRKCVFSFVCLCLLNGLLKSYYGKIYE